MSLGLVLVLGGLKAVFVVVLLGLSIGGLLTWVDRRQSAMMQDRVGPNRAVIWVPRRVAQVAVVGPAVLAALAIVLVWWFSRSIEGPERMGRAFVFSHLAIFWLWATGLVVAGRVRVRGVKNSFDGFIDWLGDPRRIFYAGLAAHAAVIVAAMTLQPIDRTAIDFALGGAGLVLVVAVLFGGLYSAYALESVERLGIRLAGLLHPAADGLKMVFKEDFVPPNADKFLHGLAPIVSFFPVLTLLAVVPFGDTLCFAPNAQGQLDFTSLLHPLATVPSVGVCATGAVKLQAVDVNVGLLFIFALAGTGIVGAALAGWSSDNKFSLLGGLRAASQMVSYEVTLGLSLIGCLMVYGTVRFDEMVAWQANNAWGVFVQPVACLMFLVASIAESKRTPFDLPEGESEIVAGYFTEYSGMKFAMFFFSEYVSVVAISGVMATAFFGGFGVPFLQRDGFYVAIGDLVLAQQQLSHVTVIVLGVLAFTIKVVALCLLQLSIRWTLPRLRYDQLMRLCWRILLPASLVNVLATGLVLLAIDAGGPSLVAGLKVAGSVTMALVAVSGLGAVIAGVLYWLQPVEHKRVPNTTAARIVAALGATPRKTQMSA